MQPFSRHAGFFASLKQVEDRLAAEQQPPPPAAARQPETLPFSDTVTASPLFLGPATDTATGDRPGGESSGPAVDFLTLSKDEERLQEEPRGGAGEDDDDDDDEIGEDIARLMALLGLSPPRRGGEGARNDGGDDDGGGCDCSGGEGFLAKVVGVVGPKCDKEKRRVDGWVEHYFSGGECREPARLAHLLLAKASSSWEGEGHRGASPFAFPATVKEFLDRDAPPRCTEE
uniref:Uncharacterized protein n=1 Tax=Oryza meridionalis TaxID=40149 RepID=A0A0E0BZV6_9ORYZ